MVMGRPKSTSRGNVIRIIVDINQVCLLHRDLAGGQQPLLRLDLGQEGRLHMEEPGHDVQCKEVTVNPLATHRRLQ